MEQENNKLNSIPMLSEIKNMTFDEICNLPQLEYVKEIVNSFGIGQKSSIHPLLYSHCDIIMPLQKKK